MRPRPEVARAPTFPLSLCLQSVKSCAPVQQAVGRQSPHPFAMPRSNLIALAMVNRSPYCRLLCPGPLSLLAVSPSGREWAPPSRNRVAYCYRLPMRNNNKTLGCCGPRRRFNHRFSFPNGTNRSTNTERNQKKASFGFRVQRSERRRSGHQAHVHMNNRLSHTASCASRSHVFVVPGQGGKLPLALAWC